jgi:hypothetical protein
MEQRGMNIKLLENGLKVRIKLAEEYRHYLIQALQSRAKQDIWPEYDLALTYEAMTALDKSPTRLRLSEFLLVFDDSTMCFINFDTQRLIRDYLDIDRFLQSRIPILLSTKFLAHE